MLRRLPALAGSLLLIAGVGAQAPGVVIQKGGPAPHAGYAASVAFLGDLDGDGRTDVAFGYPGDNIAFDACAVDVLRADGSLLRTWVGVPGSQFGTSIANIGDVDGDGVIDCAIGAPLDSSFGFVRGGTIWVKSGATGDTLYYLGGNATEDRLGYCVAGLRDIDHDGRPDFAASAVQAAPGGIGYVAVWSGRTGALITRIPGDFASEGFGFSIARAGDIDGDGTQDILVGAPFASRRAYQGGMVSVYSGSTFLRIASKSGVTDFGNLGWALATLDADWSGDGKDDYVASSPRNNDGAGYDAGSVYVFDLLGGVIARFDGAPGDRFGFAVNAGGDIDHDGRRDLVASSRSKYLQVRSGAPGHAVLDRLDAPQLDDHFGASLDMRGDVNLDGYHDIAVGAPGTGIDDAGRGYVYDMGWRVPTTLFTAHGSVAGQEFGRQVAYIGDLDGDGASEVAFAVPGLHVVRVFDHHGTLRLSLPVDAGPLSSPSIAAAGDVDGDGVPDIVVGSPNDGTAGQKAGAVRVFSGSNGALLRQAFGNPWDWLGFAVAGVGDVDDDGYDDFAAGAPQYPDPGEPYPTNHAKVWSGRDGHLLHTFTGTQDTAFGRAIARAGDIDGDGIPDILIGAPFASVRANHGGLVQVYSGATFAWLAEKSGNTDFEELGLSVGTLDDDWDGDGLDDYIAGSWQNDDGAGYHAGSLFVFNIWGNVIHRFDGAPGDAFGLQVSGGGDVDGDGHMDVVGTSDALGYMRVFAGSSDHRELRTYPAVGYFPTVDLRGDFDGDGYADLAVGCWYPDLQAGLGVIYDLRGAGRPARALVGGRACPTSAGKLPHAEVGGRPALGTQIDLDLRAALPGTGVVMLLGDATGIPLGMFGAPGCTAYVVPGAAYVATVTDGRGRASVPGVIVPVVRELIGIRLDSQWAVLDPLANPLGLVFSTRVALILGE
ncbi:MAG: FG-GAP-like repeat-containing protein [Planctomycetota bacterium]